MNTKELSELINELSVDLQAESLLALLEDRFSLHDLIVSYEGQSRRGWSKDIYLASADTLSTGAEVLKIVLNRDGVYDGMPEAVFHDLTSNDCATGGEMAKESMRLKIQEKESRLFFQPIENEIFSLGVELAIQENRLFQRIIAQTIMGLIPDFWAIDRELPASYVNKMIRLLPVVHLIAGNEVLTKQSLAFILAQEVSIQVITPGNHDTDLQDQSDTGEIGHAGLGVDFLTSGGVSGLLKQFRIRIGPINDPNTLDLIRKGMLDRFLACFYNYFVPVEVEVFTSFLLSDELGAFYLEPDDEAKTACLGCNTTIQ